jgi:UDP-glucose 4-epimerase
VRNSILDPYIDYKANVEGTANLLNSFSIIPDAKLVFANSGGAIFGETVIPADETAFRAPISPYGMHKLIGSELLKFFSTYRSSNIQILNFSNVYGLENPAKSAPALFLQKIISGEEIQIFGDGEAARDWIHVSDVVDAMILAGRADTSGEYNISTGKATTVNKLISVIENITGRKGQTKYLHAIEGEIKRSVLNPQKAITQLKWKPKISLEMGISIIFNSMDLNNE